MRTPLTSIRSFSEILLDNPALEQHQRQEFLRIIVTESERLTRLINDMLDLAKIEAGKLEWHMERVSASEVAREAATALGQLFRDKSVDLKIELPDSVPATIADRDRLFQVVVNLLSNAVKFSPRDAGLVTLTVETDTDGVRALGRRQRVWNRAEGSRRDFRALPPGRRHAHREAGGKRPRPRDLAHDRRAFRRSRLGRGGAGGGAIFRVWLPREPAAASAA